MTRVSVLLLSLVAAAASLAGTLLHLVYGEDARVERALCRYFFCAEDTQIESGYQMMYRGGMESATGVLEAFREALRRDAASPDRWCDLAEAMAQYGQAGQARRCFGRALELAANSPQVWLRAANFHFRAGDNRQALHHFAQVLKRMPVFEAVIFSYYGQMGLPITEILERGIPADRRVAQSYFRHVLGAGSEEDVKQAWAWVTAQSFTDNRLAGEYTENLLERRRYDDAAAAWKQYLGARGAAYLQSSYLYNGDFEQEPSGAVLDWRISPVDGVTAGFDKSVFHSGRQSLHLEFEGKANLAYGQISQKAVVQPGTYRLRAYGKTDGITTDRGLALRVSDAESPGRLDVRTEEVTGTNEWRLLEKTFTVPRQTKLVEVQVSRIPSLKFDNKIRGTVWIDGVTLERGGGRFLRARRSQHWPLRGPLALIGTRRRRETAPVSVLPDSAMRLWPQHAPL